MRGYRIIVLAMCLSLMLVLVGCNSKQNSNTNVETEIQTEASLESKIEEEDVEESSEIQTTVSETAVTEPEEVTWIEFKNADKNFSLMIPSNWVIVDKDRYGILIRPNRETQTSFYVDTHTTIFADYSYDDFVSDMIDDVMRIRSKSVFEAQENIYINDYPFVVLPYSETSSSGVTYFYKAFFTAKDLGYEMYYVAPEGEYDLYQPIMEDVAMSFKFID